MRGRHQIGPAQEERQAENVKSLAAGYKGESGGALIKEGLFLDKRINSLPRGSARSDLRLLTLSRAAWVISRGVAYSINFPLSPGKSIWRCTHSGALPFDNRRSWNS